MRIVVTGGAGFIGGHTVDALEAAGHVVLPMDQKTGDDLTKSRPIRTMTRFRPEAIIHLAGSCSTSGSLLDPAGTFHDTVLTAANVLEVAREHVTPLIMTSSVKARDGQTPYGAAKRMVELWSKEFESAYEIPIVINRPGTVYGPGQEGSPESGWIAWFLKCRDLHAPVTIFGDGEQERDLLHVSDFVKLQLLELDNLERWSGRTFDVGGGVKNTVTVNQIVKHLGLRASYGPPRYGDARRYVGVNQVPGWEPTVYWRDTETFA